MIVRRYKLQGLSICAQDAGNVQDDGGGSGGVDGDDVRFVSHAVLRHTFAATLYQVMEEDESGSRVDAVVGEGSSASLTSHVTPHTQDITPPKPHTSHITHHTPHTTHHTPHTTHHTPHTIHHTPHITHQKCQHT